MEEILKERPIMSEEEFTQFLDNGRLCTFEAIGKFRHIRRAIKKGHVSPFGEIYPKRPFSNKANTCKRKGHHSRSMNELKKQIYEQLKCQSRKAS